MSIVSLVARHSRYVLIFILCLFSGLFLLASRRRLPSKSYTNFDSFGSIRTIKSKLEQSETIYWNTLDGRKELIRKFGPDPSQIDAFPPNIAPWPPYTIWDFFPAAFQCPWEVERIGVLGDGGKWLCGLSRLVTKPSCVIYSVGIDGQSSFESELLTRTQHCEVWGYDYSVKKFGPMVERYPVLKARTHFAQHHISGENSHVPEDSVPVWTLPAVMKANGHSWVDVLKIDVEGWEFSTLGNLLEAFRDSEGEVKLPFGQLQLEIHVWNKKFVDVLEWWEALEAAGLRPFWTEPNLIYANYNRDGSPELAEYSFINIKGSHDLITDAPDKPWLYEGAKRPRPDKWR